MFKQLNNTFTRTKQRIKNVLIVLVLIILFASLNPNNADFKNYLSGNYNAQAFGGRTQYFFFFSFFQATVLLNGTNHHITYLGIFKNFIALKDQQQ